MASTCVAYLETNLHCSIAMLDRTMMLPFLLPFHPSVDNNDVGPLPWHSLMKIHFWPIRDRIIISFEELASITIAS